MGIIKLDNISKEYKSDSIVTQALSGISFEVEKGDFIAIIGASGSGKTTLLNIMGCMDKPTSGQYLLDGKPLEALSEDQLSHIRGRRIAFVFQNFALLDNDTVFANVELPLLKRGLSRAERKQRVDTALAAVGISELARKKTTHISGGQKQRTAIARAIACGADIILADEPTGALDSKTAEEVMKLLRKMNDDGRTLIVITHDMKVAGYAHKIIEIKDGRITPHDKKAD